MGSRRDDGGVDEIGTGGKEREDVRENWLGQGFVLVVRILRGRLAGFHDDRSCEGGPANLLEAERLRSRARRTSERGGASRAQASRERVERVDDEKDQRLRARRGGRENP